MKQLSDRIASLFCRKAAAMDRANRFVRGGLVLLGAVLAGASQLLPSASPTATGVAAVPVNLIVGWLGAILALAGGIWSLIVDETVPSALEEAREAIEKAREAEAVAKEIQEKYHQEQEELLYSVEWLSLLYACIPPLREVVENLLRTNCLPTDQDMQAILTMQARNIVHLLEFETMEYWTLAIYRHEGATPNVGTLICSAHMRAQRSDEQREHRSWPVGEGIAGHTFSIGRELVVEDLRVTSQGGWVKVSDTLRRPGDDDRYRSFAAVPIRAGNSPVVWGVVVASSDIPGRFGPSENGAGSRNIEALRLLAGMASLSVAPHICGNVRSSSD